MRLAALAALVLTGTAVAAAPHRTSGLHDARYCELIEVKGVPPHAKAVVWNTIGLGSCPAAQWDAFDAGSLAKELGDTLVLLNGPRHFLMDSVSARPGRVHAFHGMRMRRAATIALRSADDLLQTPYSDRTINRRNTWRWKSGRRVFELVAPGGDVYVMQSYAQIRDPKLSIRDLRSLGRRLDLPSGWRYRSRALRRPLVLGARGSATIVQDDLLDTYQLARATRRGKRRQRRVSLSARTRSVKPTTPGTIEDRGTIRGKPFGRGKVTVIGKLADGRFSGTFTIVGRRGSVSGKVSMPFTIGDGHIHFKGTARFTAGTGAFRGISRRKLTVRDTNTLDGQNGRLSVSGVTAY